MYATKEDLAAWLGYVTEAGEPDVSKLPENADKLLRDAGDVINHAAMNRIKPLNNRHTLAAQKAVTAQVEYWIDGVGESVDINPDIASYSAGSTSFTFANGQIPKLAPRARRALFAAGLLYRGVVRA